MLNTGIRKLRRRGDASPTRSMGASLTSLRAAGFWRTAAPFVAAAVMVAIVLLRMTWSPTPDGDPALHLRLIKDIAASRSLPTELPFHPARVAPGGEIEAMFPYSYPPLYHVTAAILYSLGGLRAALALNAIAAAVIAYFVCRFTARGAPSWVAVLAAPAAFVSPYVQVPFTSFYLEPMMLAFLFAGAWCAYMALAFRQTGYGIVAGLLLGLAMATRQNAMFPIFVLGLVMLWHLTERRAWTLPRFRKEAPWFAAIIVAAALAAAPAMLYLLQVTGTFGYADLSLPGMHPTLPIDPTANAYIASITKPSLPPVGWLARYEQVVLYADRWLPTWMAALPLLLFVAGSMHMYQRGGAARFFARWAVLEVVAEIVLFVTLHGNARYIVVSQMLVYAIVPVGGYALFRAAARWGDGRGVVRYAACAVVLLLAPVALYAMVPAGSLRDSYLRSHDRDLRAFRGGEYAEMGAWVNENTPPDSLILTPRTYTAELTWQRNDTWVTFYGNSWVIDAIGEKDPRVANELLRWYGVDYVLVTDPPGTYIDRMPADGMRRFLQFGADTAPYFSLVHMSESDGAYYGVEHALRLYRVEPSP